MDEFDRMKPQTVCSNNRAVGDSYDKVLAEAIIGLLTIQVIRRRGPWRDIEAHEHTVYA